MYFGGLAATKQKATGAKVYTVAATALLRQRQLVLMTLRPSPMLLPRSLSYFAAPRKFPVRAQTSPSATLLLALVVALLRKLTFRWLATFALRLAAELGCSRPLAENVDWMPRNLYIGVSGLQLAPKAYIAFGISGQMQHMVGVTGC